MKSFIVYGVLAFIVVSLQSTVFPYYVKPDLALVLVCFYSIRGDEIKGMIFGAITGLLVDSVSGLFIGPNVLSKSIIGFLFGLVRHKFFFWNVFLNTILVALFSLIDIFIVRISLEVFFGLSFPSRAIMMLLMAVPYTAVAGLIFYPAFRSEVYGWRRG